MPEGHFMGIASRPLSRRRFIAGSVSTAALTTALTWTGGIAKPYLSRATDRPLITHGLQSGAVGLDSGVVWARSDRPARMQIEIATTDRGYSRRRLRGCSAGQRFHGQTAAQEAPGRPGYLLPHPLSGPCKPDDRRRADGGPLSHRAARPPFDFVLLVGRSSRPGLGHRRVARRPGADGLPRNPSAASPAAAPSPRAATLPHRRAGS